MGAQCLRRMLQYTLYPNHHSRIVVSLEKPLAHGDKLPNEGLLIEKGNVRGTSDERVNAAVVVLDERHVEPR